MDRLLAGAAPISTTVPRQITVDAALWASNALPEGVVERWFVTENAVVAAGQAIAELRIEDALHVIVTPASGRLSIVAPVNTLVEPGSLLASLALGDARPTKAVNVPGGPPSR